MDASTRTLVIVAACGAVVAAGFGAVAGAGLRVPPRALDAPSGGGQVIATQDVFAATAPAYPTWAPEPLYPGAERDPVAAFAEAWDAAMTDAPRGPRPAVFGPPPDLPPPYEVRLEGEARAIETRPAGQPAMPGNPRAADRSGKS